MNVSEVFEQPKKVTVYQNNIKKIYYFNIYSQLDNGLVVLYINDDVIAIIGGSFILDFEP